MTRRQTNRTEDRIVNDLWKRLWAIVAPKLPPAIVALATALATVFIVPRPAPAPPDNPTPAGGIIGPATANVGQTVVFASHALALQSEQWAIVGCGDRVADVAPQIVRLTPTTAGTCWIVVAGVDAAGKTQIATHALRVSAIGPLPPNPPGPKPPPPTPPDDFQNRMQAAYGADGTPGKAQHKTAWAEVCRGAAKNAANAAIRTWGQLFEVYAGAAFEMGLNDKLTACRDLAGQRLAQRLPSKGAAQTEIDAAGRTLAAAEFTALAEIWDRLQ